MVQHVVKATISERDGIDLEYREEINPIEDILQALGIVCKNEIVVTGGNADPSVEGFEAEEGSAYFCGNGYMYKKEGPNITDWVIFSGGSGGPIYLKDILDVDNNLAPTNDQVLQFIESENIWKAESICYPSEDYGLITVPADCGNLDYGGIV